MSMAIIQGGPGSACWVPCMLLDVVYIEGRHSSLYLVAIESPVMLE